MWSSFEEESHCNFIVRIDRIFELNFFIHVTRVRNGKNIKKKKIHLCGNIVARARAR